MSTVKISALPAITQLNANTSNTLFLGVDIPTGVTGKMTAHILAQGLFSNEILNVGQNQQNLPNTVAQFSLSGNSYIQTNLVNTNDGGTADIVITANTGSGGTDSTYFTDLGFANKSVQPGLEFNNLGTALSPLDGYLYVQGAAVGGPAANGGNLLIGTTSTNTEIRFIGGGYNASNIVAKITGDGFKMVNGHPIYFTDGTTQNTAAASNAYSQSAFATANSASANTIVSQGVDLTQNTSIQSSFNQANSANALAQSAFNKANNALANTTGTFAGDLTITGNTFAQKINTSNLFVNGTANVSGTLGVTGIVSGNAQILIQNTNFLATESALTISASPSVATPSNDGYMVHISGKNGISSRVVTDSYGTGAYAVYAARTARGNVTNPAPVQTNDIIGRYSANGFGNTKFQQFGTGRIDFVATENYTDANTGSLIQFWSCPVGSNTLTNIATFNGSSVIFSGVVNPQKGFIYTPSVYPGAQTAITLDFANNSVVRAQTSSGLVVSLSNYTVGKIIELWVTNTAGTNQTFTHGISAINSTTNSTTYTIPGTSSILAKYMCIDGTLANTLVAVIHA
jgi:hypothetical protein